MQQKLGRFRGCLLGEVTVGKCERVAEVTAGTVIAPSARSQWGETGSKR